MKDVLHQNHAMNLTNSFMKWPLLIGLLSLLAVSPARATLPLYQNTFPNFYNSGSPPPNLDVLAFDNESIFSIEFGTFSTSTEFYQTLNTLYYTNNGSMVIDTGFKFDLFTTNLIPDAAAGTFFNPGSVFCDSSELSDFIFFSEAGKFIAWATNIINSGSVDVGENVLIQFSGPNVSL